MKKIFNTILFVIIAFLLIFSVKSNAADLDTLDITTDKQIVNPNTNVVLNIDFGRELNSYTFNIDYDDALFEYVSVEGATANNTGTKVIATYYDSTGGTNPRTSMSVTFKAKDGITTSNPTDFSITAAGLAYVDTSTVSFDDITTPIIKNVVVEPKYTDYDIDLKYTGEIKSGVEKDMQLTVSSVLGRYYDHARIIAESQTPGDATVKLLATDDQQLEHDIIESGWGDASGYKIGGDNVNQVLNVRGLFSEEGKYSITIKLIDRDDSDAVIATKTFDITVAANVTDETPEQTPGQTPEQTPEEKPEETPEETPTETPEQTPEQTPTQTPEQTPNEETPEELPKTGYNELIVIVPMLVILMFAYARLSRKDI